MKEAKALIAYAQKRGLKSLKFGDLEVVFNDSVIYQKARKPKLVPIESSGRPAPPPEPTLDEINRYIYSDLSESG